MDFVEIRTIHQDEDNVTRHYIISKSEVPFDELIKMPKTVQEYYVGRIKESYITCRMDKARKNVYFGHKNISLVKAGGNIFLKNTCINHFTFFNGKFYGDSVYDDYLIQALLMELEITRIAIPLHFIEVNPMISILQNKTIIKQILAGKITTREELLLANFKVKYRITTVKPETIEDYYSQLHCDGYIPLSILKGPIAPDKLDYTINRIMEMRPEEKALFLNVIEKAHNFGIQIEPTINGKQMLETKEHLAKMSTDQLVKYKAISDEKKQYGYTAYLEDMVPITSEAEAHFTQDIFTDYFTRVQINLKNNNNIYFHYKKGDTEALILIQKKSDGSLSHSCIAPQPQNYFINDELREIISKKIRKNKAQLIKMLDSLPANDTKPADRAEKLPF